MITLKTLPQATAQEVFNQVKTHLLTQNKKSGDSYSSPDFTCLYRGPEGLKCAAGCLVADEEYEQDMEEKTWIDLLNLEKVPIDHSSLIIDLQHIHDDYESKVWPEGLKRIAKIYNLKYTD